LISPQQAELTDFQQALLAKQQRPKFSRELLNLRKIQEHLAKQKDYTEAHKIKLKSDALEAWELEKWKNSKQQEMFQREAKFKHQKQTELVALQKRIQVHSPFFCHICVLSIVVDDELLLQLERNIQEHHLSSVLKCTVVTSSPLWSRIRLDAKSRRSKGSWIWSASCNATAT
jgi:hypothetical protein